MDRYFCNKKIEIKSKQIEETGKAFMRTHAQNVFHGLQKYATCSKWFDAAGHRVLDKARGTIPTQSTGL